MGKARSFARRNDRSAVDPRSCRGQTRTARNGLLGFRRRWRRRNRPGNHPARRGTRIAAGIRAVPRRRDGRLADPPRPTNRARPGHHRTRGELVGRRGSTLRRIGGDPRWRCVAGALRRATRRRERRRATPMERPAHRGQPRPVPRRRGYCPGRHRTRHRRANHRVQDRPLHDCSPAPNGSCADRPKRLGRIARQDRTPARHCFPVARRPARCVRRVRHDRQARGRRSS